MAEPPAAPDPELVYEVLLAATPPEELRARFPAMSVRPVAARTSLRRRVRGAQQLEVLLDKLSSLGLPLVEVHRVPGAAGEVQTYEVDLAGEVGDPVLRYLAWPHVVVPEQACVRLAAASEDLHEFLRACTDCGAAIQRVHVVDAAGRRPGGGLVSRGRGDDRGGPPRPSG